MWTIVKDYKYLGTHIDNKLDCVKNTNTLYKNGQSHLYFLRQLRSFCWTIFRMFYESVVLLSSMLLCAGAAGSSRLTDLLESWQWCCGNGALTVFERRMLSKRLWQCMPHILWCTGQPSKMSYKIIHAFGHQTPSTPLFFGWSFRTSKSIDRISVDYLFHTAVAV